MLMELLHIQTAVRPDGTKAFLVHFVLTFPSLQKIPEKKTVSANININLGVPPQLNVAAENKLTILFDETEWQHVKTKLIVGKEYELKVSAKKIELIL